MGIMAAGRCQVGRIGVEIDSALFAPMLRVDHFYGMRSPGPRVPQVVQLTFAVGVPVASASALGTLAATVISGTDLYGGLREIFG